jgi:hypothetical protein
MSICHHSYNSTPLLFVSICHLSYNGTPLLFVQQGNPALSKESVSCWPVETPERDLDDEVPAREGLNEEAFGEKCPKGVVWTDIEWYQQGPGGDCTAPTHVGISLWLARFVARSLFHPRRADGSDGL